MIGLAIQLLSNGRKISTRKPGCHWIVQGKVSCYVPFPFLDRFMTMA